MIVSSPKNLDPKTAERKEASEFLSRVNKVKVDPMIKGHGNMVSGLLERKRWTFVCSKHVTKRFENEEELRRHFSRAFHSA
jgi:hypothetical protein